MRVPPGQGPYKFSLLGMVQGNLMGLRHTHIHAYDMMASGLTPALITGVVGQLWFRTNALQLSV